MVVGTKEELKVGQVYVKGLRTIVDGEVVRHAPQPGLILRELTLEEFKAAALAEGFPKDKVERFYNVRGWRFYEVSTD